jgi:hypothetical protein
MEWRATNWKTQKELYVVWRPGLPLTDIMKYKVRNITIISWIPLAWYND